MLNVKKRAEARGVSNDRLLNVALFESVINKTASACYVGSSGPKQLGWFAEPSAECSVNRNKTPHRAFNCIANTFS